MLATTMKPESRVKVLEAFSEKDGNHHWSIPHVASQDFKVTKGSNDYTVSCLTIDKNTNYTLNEVATFSLGGQFLSGSRQEVKSGGFDRGTLSEQKADQVLNRLQEIRSPQVVGSLAKQPFREATPERDVFQGMTTPSVLKPHQG